jgi:hypothetical protein
VLAFLMGIHACISEVVLLALEVTREAADQSALEDANRASAIWAEVA